MSPRDQNKQYGDVPGDVPCDVPSLLFKDLIKAIPTSRGMNSGLDHTPVVQTRVRPFGACTRVWTETRVDTRPRSPLLVGIVYVYDTPLGGDDIDGGHYSIDLYKTS